MSIDRVGVVGTGLIGASVGLALAATGRRPLLWDPRPEHTAEAMSRGAGAAVRWEELQACDHVVLAVPVGVFHAVLTELAGLNPHATLSDTLSVKAKPLAEASSVSGAASRFCGAHPVAGGEGTGPRTARRDMFRNAAWVLTPGPQTSGSALRDAEDLALACGARPVQMTADTHDALLAAVSHAPQLVASVLAGRVLTETAAPLAGPGLRDVTRIAGSDPDLWVDIVSANPGPVAAVLRQLTADLAGLADQVAAGDTGAIRAALVRGRAGRARLPTA